MIHPNENTSLAASHRTHTVFYFFFIGGFVSFIFTREETTLELFPFFNFKSDLNVSVSPLQSKYQCARGQDP